MKCKSCCMECARDCYRPEEDAKDKRIEQLEAANDRLKGNLRNCVGHLEHAQRKEYGRKTIYEGVIDSANKAIYETSLETQS